MVIRIYARVAPEEEHQDSLFELYPHDQPVLPSIGDTVILKNGVRAKVNERIFQYSKDVTGNVLEVHLVVQLDLDESIRRARKRVAYNPEQEEMLRRADREFQKSEE